MNRKSWTQDEQITVLYYYFKGAKGYKEHPLVQELSRKYIKNHSINSIAMKISNYVSLDEGKEGGLSNTSQLDKRTWEEFSGNKELLEKKAKEILSSFSITKGESLNDDPLLSESTLLPEGSNTSIFVNRYERNPKARRKCIEHYGTKCQLCSFDFEEKYGAIGKDFIEFHHKVPISEIGGSYEVDSINDLIPVCSNCHSMLHRKKGEALRVEELKDIVREIELR